MTPEQHRELERTPIDSIVAETYFPPDANSPQQVPIIAMPTVQTVCLPQLASIELQYYTFERVPAGWKRTA